jgi:hypothetical protein
MFIIYRFLTILYILPNSLQFGYKVKVEIKLKKLVYFVKFVVFSVHPVILGAIHVWQLWSRCSPHIRDQ